MNVIITNPLPHKCYLVILNNDNEFEQTIGAQPLALAVLHVIPTVPGVYEADIYGVGDTVNIDIKAIEAVKLKFCPIEIKSYLATNMSPLFNPTLKAIGVGIQHSFIPDSYDNALNSLVISQYKQEVE